MIALQLLINALSIGAAYSLVALGFVLILNATAAVNFSQGALVMLGGFVAVTLARFLPVSGIVLLPLVLAIMALVGLALSALAYFPLLRRPPETVFISTIAIGIVLENGATALFGPEPKSAPALLGGGDWTLGSLVLSRQSLAIVASAAVLILLLHGLFAHTQFGRRLRATAQDRDMAQALGVPVERMIAVTFALGTALAGAAGLLLANSFFVSPTDGTNYILKAYIAVAIGGWGSIPGAVLGAFLIALFEVIYPAIPALVPTLGHGAYAETLFSQTTSTILFDVAILAILTVRPRGLFDNAARTRP
jgi:branched-chain amino acid transport system permease protein